MKRTALIAATLSLAACSFYARGQDDYRKAVREVLDTRSADVEKCYRAELSANEQAKGKVVVQFDVEPKTGKFVGAKVVEGESTPNKPLQQCVLGSLDGLAIAPPDQRKGEATFTWEFNR
jgi:outer membrane biosynthesis protein TonB